jgi:hypothetical protein
MLDFFQGNPRDLVAGFFKRTFNHAVGKTFSRMLHGMSNVIVTLWAG